MNKELIEELVACFDIYLQDPNSEDSPEEKERLLLTRNNLAYGRNLSDEDKKTIIEEIKCSCGKDSWNFTNLSRFWKEALVELGGVREITKEEMDKIVSLGRGTKYWFKLKGKYYI